MDYFFVEILSQLNESPGAPALHIFNQEIPPPPPHTHTQNYLEFQLYCLTHPMDLFKVN